MNTEIERKFLVKNTSFIQEATRKHHIVQGFLNSDKQRVVRIRLQDDKGFLTIKGISNASGTSRLEWEREISKQEALELLQLCEPGQIEKYRYLVSYDDFTFEVDEFLGENTGLIVAEIELTHEHQHYPIPKWLGKEVTGEPAYYNAELSKNPYKNWK